MSEITRYPLCWPNNVPRTAPHTRGTPQFQLASISSCVYQLKREVNRLNNRRWDYEDPSLIISSNLRLKLNGEPASNTEAPDAGIAVYFTLRFFRNGKSYERPCVLTCDKWRRAADNMKAIYKDIEAQRARQRWGCTSVEQAFQGYLAIPERCGGKSWWELLSIPSTATQDQIRERYRALSKIHHPDLGGNHQQWTEFQEAYDQAMASFR